MLGVLTRLTPAPAAQCSFCQPCLGGGNERQVAEPFPTRKELAVVRRGSLDLAALQSDLRPDVEEVFGDADIVLAAWSSPRFDLLLCGIGAEAPEGDARPMPRSKRRRPRDRGTQRLGLDGR